MNRLAFLVIPMACLAACASDPAAERAHALREAARIMNTHGAACEKLGYVRDTEGWRTCLLRLEDQAIMREQMMLDRTYLYNPYPYFPYYPYRR